MSRRTIQLFLCVFLPVLVLTACGKVPQPFRHEGTAREANPLLTLDSARGVVVLPLDGVDEQLGTLFAEAMTQTLAEDGIPTAKAEGGNVAGRLMASGRVYLEDRDANRVTVSIEWILLDVNGVQMSTYLTREDLDRRQLERLSIAEALTLTKGASLAFADLLRENPGPEVTPTADQPLVIVFETVTGAPGNNGELLRNALMSILNKSGATTVRQDEMTDEVPDFIIGAAIKGTPEGDDKTRLAVHWMVKDKDGKELGAVDLANPVARQLYTAYWGPLAHDIALGSVEGIAQIINAEPAR